jgi:hypothetical protein
VSGAIELWTSTVQGAPLKAVIGLLDRTLLALLTVMVVALVGSLLMLRSKTESNEVAIGR